MKTHRCEGSLANQASIRECKPHSHVDYGWWLYELQCNYEGYGSDWYNHAAYRINYCPFCGTRLSEGGIVSGDG